jgi:uncharacterized protein YjbI with pentapeptide repeats/nucleoside phosphorylase
MASQEHLTILRLGVDRWNEWRIANPSIRPDLDDVSLEDTDLSGLDLSQASLRNVTFRNVKFGNCNLSDADLRGAVLSGSDLSGVAGFLEPQQLAGTDLTGVKLPGSLQELFESLDVAKGVSANAQNLFVAMLAACLYSWLTIATTSDVNLIVNRATSPLPIIGTSIPIVGFYFVAPLLLVGVYFYFHLYLQKLWDEMGSLPAIFPDGRPLQAKADPWLLSDLVRSHVSRLKWDRPFLSYFQEWISIVLAWWLVPFTLILFWGRYLRRHDVVITMLHCLLAAICITSAIFLYRLAGATLRGDPRRPFVWSAAMRRPRAWRPLIVALMSGTVLVWVSFSAIDGVRLGVAGRDWWPAAEASSIRSHFSRTWIPTAMEKVGYTPFADLRGANLTAKPAVPIEKGSVEKQTVDKSDVEKDDVDEDDIDKSDAATGDLANVGAKKDEAMPDSAPGLQLSGVDLRFADMRGSNLQGTILTDARLEWADLLKANLNGAELAGAHMDHADLLGANLANADMTGTSLNGANLNQADLRGAELQYADLKAAQGLTRDALTSSRNWCNALYTSGVESALGLPADNNDRIERWREDQESIIREYPVAAESARVEQLSRLFPGINTHTLLGRLNDPTLAATASIVQEESDENALDEEARTLVPIPWPEGTAPIAAPMQAAPTRDSVLPAADYLVITWTVAETGAIAAVFTPGYSLKKWYNYAHNFDSKFKNRIAKGAPASETHTLGRYFLAKVDGKKVLLLKSDLHFSQDGPDLPLKDMLEQAIQESGAKLVVTTGTAGSIGRGLQVGDVLIASRATFLLRRTFKDEDFNGKTVSNEVNIPAAQVEFANQNLLQANASKLSAVRQGEPPVPRIYWDTAPQPNTVVTVDFFAFDDTLNHYNLQCAGSVIEMSDAVLGLVSDDIEKQGKSAPKWLSIRNVNAPQASGDSLKDKAQRLAKIYSQYAFWTTIQSAIATWAVITGMN